jgi:hypothetical protein
MWSNASWGEWIFSHGTKNFYTNNVWAYSWPTQPPLINSIYAQNKKLYVELLGRFAWTEYQLKKLTGGRNIPWLSGFVTWFAYSKINPEIPFQLGFLVVMKLWPILADMVIAGLIYELAGKKLVGVIAYMASPFSWSLSALWGQYDGVEFVFAFLAYITVFTGFSFLGPGLMAIAFLIKPTALILVPYYLYLYLKKAGGPMKFKLLNCLIAPLLILYVTTAPYTDKNPLIFTRYDLVRMVFEKAEPRLSVNAFNFWRIFTGNNPVNADVHILGIGAGWWSIVIFAALNLAALYLSENRGEGNFRFWDGIFLIGAGSWLFMTGMLDRYLFAGMVGGLIAAVHRPGLYKYWVVWSIIFWINLYYHWWVPAGLPWLEQLLLWNNDVLTRFLSLANVFLFGIMSANIIGLPARWKPGSFQKSLCRLIRKLTKPAGIWKPAADKYN